MKKFLLVIILCIQLFCLAACDPRSYSYEYDELLDSVVSVELINYDNPNQKKFVTWVLDYTSKLLPFELNNMTILETLNNDDIDDFLQQLSEARLLHKYYVFNSPKDICIRLIYTNGDFEVISCDYAHQTLNNYVGKYNSSGDVVDFVGSFESYDDFENLVNDFFVTDLT